MWSPEDSECAEDDLEALVDIFNMCAGDLDDDGRDNDGRNASLDAIRMMLVHDFPLNNPLDDPLHSLTPSVTDDPQGRNMVRELLVYGSCASEGRTKEWLENWDEDDVLFLASVAQEFAEAKASGVTPDPMERCAYHDHASVSDRLRCEQGVRRPSSAVRSLSSRDAGVLVD
jgi:hypothetical protein